MYKFKMQANIKTKIFGYGTELLEKINIEIIADDLESAINKAKDLINYTKKSADTIVIINCYEIEEIFYREKGYKNVISSI